MKLIALFICALLCISGSIATADPHRGQSVIYKVDSTHSFGAIVTRVIDADTADIMVLSWGTLWTALDIIYTSEATPMVYLAAVDEGSGDGQWTANPLVYSGSVVSATSSPALTLGGAGVQLDATHETIYTATVSIDLTTTLLAGEGGTVRLLCDSGATPTTEVGTLQFFHGPGLAQSASTTSSMQWRTAPGDYCRLTTTNDVSTPVFTLVRQRLQVLD